MRKKSGEDVHRLLIDDPTKNDADKVYLNPWDNWDIKKLPAKQAFFSLVKRRLSQARGERDTRGAQDEGNLRGNCNYLALRFRLLRFALGPVFLFLSNMKPCLVILFNCLPVLQACGKPSFHLVESRGEIRETGKCGKWGLERRPTPSDNAVFLLALTKHTTTSCKSTQRHCTVFWLNGLSIFFVLYLTDL